MIMKRNFIVVLIASLFLGSCSMLTSRTLSKDDVFRLLYPNCTMNSSLIFLPLQPNYKFDKFLTLSYRNTSQEQIAYYPGQDVKIFLYENKSSKWLEVNNDLQTITSPKPYVVIGSANEMSSYGSITVSPKLSDNNSMEIRVVITGSLYKEEIITDECTGAFIDVQP